MALPIVNLDVSGIGDLLPVFAPKDISVLKQDLIAGYNAGIITTTGSNQLLFDIAPAGMAAISSNCIVNINADMSFLNLPGNPAGFRFAFSQSDVSGATAFTRDYITDVSTTMMVAAPSIVLNRAIDFPDVDASLNVLITNTDSFSGYDIPTGVTLHYSYSIQSLP